MQFSRKIFACMVATTLAVTIPVFGGVIPYANPGTVVPPSVITAPTTGQMVAYFCGSAATHLDMVAITDVTAGWTSPWFFSNHSTAVGSSFVAGHVTAGDVLEFRLWDIFTDLTYSMNPANNVDGINHFYFTPHTEVGPGSIPIGTFVGGEDLSLDISDLNYADDQFVYTITAIPEPATLALVGLGLVAVGLFRRVRSRR